jgi:hypothetical protein
VNRASLLREAVLILCYAQFLKRGALQGYLFYDCGGFEAVFVLCWPTRALSFCRIKNQWPVHFSAAVLQAVIGLLDAASGSSPETIIDGEAPGVNPSIRFGCRPSFLATFYSVPAALNRSYMRRRCSYLEFCCVLLVLAFWKATRQAPFLISAWDMELHSRWKQRYPDIESKPGRTTGPWYRHLYTPF